MKKRILYAVQGTGNGHLSRAVDIFPALQKHGDVDLLISGYQSEISLPFPIKHRYQGLSFIFGKEGGINLSESIEQANISQLQKEIREVPVLNYDLVINDFEPVTAWACHNHQIPCISFSHQAAVIHSAAPKPKRFNPLGRLILNQYAPTQLGIGFHFQRYGDGITTPLIKEEIRQLELEELGHHTVYLPAYADDRLVDLLSQIQETRWHVFSKRAKRSFKVDKVSVYPVDARCFQESLRTCKGVLCGAGFELPAEALYLGKKLLAIPMKGQYEQQCNAKALKLLGVKTLKKLSPKRLEKVRDWVNHGERIQVDYPNETQVTIDRVLEDQPWLKYPLQRTAIKQNFERFSGVLLHRMSDAAKLIAR